MSNINTSGISAFAYNVVVKQDAIEEQTKGGLFLPDEAKDRQMFRTQRGVIVSMGPKAFSDLIDEEDAADRPSPGDRVIWARNAGFLHDGPDGETYRVLPDKDVMGRLTDE